MARDLKYYSPPTDLSALQRELQNKRDAEGESSRYAEESDDWADEDATSVRYR